MCIFSCLERCKATDITLCHARQKPLHKHTMLGQCQKLRTTLVHFCRSTVKALTLHPSLVQLRPINLFPQALGLLGHMHWDNKKGTQPTCTPLRRIRARRSGARPLGLPRGRVRGAGARPAQVALQRGVLQEHKHVLLCYCVVECEAILYACKHAQYHRMHSAAHNPKNKTIS